MYKDRIYLQLKAAELSYRETGEHHVSMQPKWSGTGNTGVRLVALYSTVYSSWRVVCHLYCAFFSAVLVGI